MEKHNTLYAIQFALHEYDETGAVSRRTMEMLGARAILLRYEIEGEVAEALAREKAKKKAEEPAPPTNVVPMKERAPIKKRKNGRINCAECGTRLTGQQRKYCSKRCSKKHWLKNNRERVKQHNREWYQRQKVLDRV
jgi:DNA invertase Pin-like site-specific DNA recombinase